MAAPALTSATLPGQAELQNFAHAAAQLLVERRLRSAGARTVARRAGVGIQHLDHRDYAPGDEVRHIDWRQTARSRRPIVRRFESETAADWTLLVDASSSMAVAGAAKWQAAVSMAAALSYALLQMGHRVGLLAFGARVLAQCPRGRGPQHYAAIARLLQGLRPAAGGEGSEPGVCARHLHGAASVFTISDFLAAGEMRRDLGVLQQRCGALHAVQLRDAADTRLALAGSGAGANAGAGEVELFDVETGAHLAAQASAGASEHAAAARAAMTQRLRGHCARSGVAFTDWDIAQPWQQALLQHLLRARSLC